MLLFHLEIWFRIRQNTWSFLVAVLYLCFQIHLWHTGTVGVGRADGHRCRRFLRGQGIQSPLKARLKFISAKSKIYR
ncbi:hypothetical protein C8R45DRAFT_967062 [Mycena sanguinolenta]|nr:hypothetical protein C8R45DRAFT_967062 [Mycena sanguinolenta]